ncbi:putative ribosomal-protein-alanine acetyltransferase [Erwinia phage vB_EamM_Stratton]|uniref:N-acetyltransferase domain-containing protein n=2 Tax=Erskinevirus EaH2 TaxID=2169883 RepID=J7KE15_9CAUD|nr:acetyltransferase [Erwinia phage phiEaH2]AFQ96659.1 hypothetical protein [Erwinia phage phiEaH2]ANZ50638.1 putative ribosomal-protein-alanine acetyltransferase [Erwinia phage vB_EamM_Stratton]
MTEIVILSSSSDFSEAAKKQLLALHYKFLNHQRNTLHIDKAVVPELSIEKLMAGNRVAVAMESGSPVGYCLYRIIGGVLKIRTMFVSEAYRRRGFMTQILDALGSKETFHRIHAGVFAKEEPAVTFFKARDFNCVPSRDGDWLEVDKFIISDEIKAEGTLAVA